MKMSTRVARSLWHKFGPAHQLDGITTHHSDGFRATAEFKKAYARSVQAAGWDYSIPYRIHQALWCAKNALKVPGAFVELGTGRGFVMSDVLTLGINRPVHLFDTFLPSLPGKEASPVYAVDFESVVANFAEWPRTALHRGDVFDTLPKAKLDAVAFLHVDLNCAEPEVFAVRHLWPSLSQGAVMLFDDYAYIGYEPQYAAINNLAYELGFHILSTPTGQGIVIK